MNSFSAASDCFSLFSGLDLAQRVLEEVISANAQFQAPLQPRLVRK